jgi:hypothetical protein
MAREKEHVSRLHSPSESHEEARVEKQDSGHVFRDLLYGLVNIHEGSADQSPVSCRAPEVDCLGSYGTVYEKHYFVHIEYFL